MSKIAKILGFGPPKIPSLPAQTAAEKTPSIVDPSKKINKDRQRIAAANAIGRKETRRVPADRFGDVAPVRRARLLGQSGTG